MKELQQFCPEVNDKLVKLPCHGDAKSVQQMTEAKRQRSMELTPKDRLEGLEELPQEFHHRGNVMEVSFI